MATTNRNVGITFDTNRLRNDIRRIEEAVSRLETENTKMTADITELTTMWSGPAKDEFLLQFTLDRMLLNRTILYLKKYSKDLTDICTYYEQADNDAAAEIAQLR